MELTNNYYSGQGSLYIGTRSAAGKPEGLVRVGNVPELTIDIAVTNFEHKESESGDRLIDLVISKEKKGSFKFKLENLTLDNLAMGLYGTSVTVAAGAVVAEAIKLYRGKRTPLAFPDVSAVVLTAVDAAAAVTRANTTAYAVGAFIKPAIANLHYYQVTVAGTSAASPPTFPLTGGTVADGTATILDMGLIAPVLDTDYTVDAKNGVIEVAGLPSVPSLGGSFTVAYSYAASKKMDAFTETAPERWLRFEGLNTVDDSRVVVDIFKAHFDPLTGYSLINDELGSTDMAGTILADSLQVTGSKFFRQWNITA